MVHPDGNGTGPDPDRDADRDRRHRLRHVPGPGHEPRWSPDGQKIAFQTRGDPWCIYDDENVPKLGMGLINPDGSGYTTLVPGGYPDFEIEGPPIWAPDSAHITYAASGATFVGQRRRRSREAGNGLPAAERLAAPAREHALVVRAPPGATPVYASLVPAHSPCTAPNSTHGAPLSFGACGPPAPTSANLTVGTPDANGLRANSLGFMELRVRVGALGGPDDSDVRIKLGVQSVYRASDLADYTGELEARTTLRLTDKRDGIASTTIDIPLSFCVPCIATADPNAGGNCAIDTTADALRPGLVPEGQRSNWELGPGAGLRRWRRGRRREPATTPVPGAGPVRPVSGHLLSPFRRPLRTLGSCQRRRGRRLRFSRHLIAVLVFGAVLAPIEAMAADGMTVSRVSLGPTGGNAPTPSEYVGPWGDNSGARAFESPNASTNDWFMRTPLAEGSSAYFSTQESLVAEDTDSGLRDIYRNDGTRTELVTTGPGAGQPPRGYCDDFFVSDCGFEASRDTSHAIFSFGESLLPEDTDGGFNDLFGRFDGTTALLSTGPAATNGPFNVCLNFGGSCSYIWVSADGSRVVFATEEKLVPEDNDSDCSFTLERTCFDLYERVGGVTRLLTTRAVARARYPGRVSRHRVGRSSVLFPFLSMPAMSSSLPTEPSSPTIATCRRTSTRASTARRASFRPAQPTRTRQSKRPGAAPPPTGPARTSGSMRRSRTTPRRDPESTSDPGRHAAAAARGTGQSPRRSGRGLFRPFLRRHAVFFSTSARLVGEDTDSRRDLYSYSDHGYELVSTGPTGGTGPFDICDGSGPCLEAASRDGTKVYFTTEEPLVAGDTDNVCSRFVGVPHPCEDIYVRDLSRGTTELVSTGPGPSNGVQFDFLFLDAISADGSRAYFRTKMALVPQDTRRRTARHL